MEPTFGFWDLIPLLGAAQGVFLALVFLFHPRGNVLANRFLGLLLLVFSLRLLSILAFWTKHLLVFPHFSLVSFPFSYLIGVFLYFYAKYLIGSQRNLERSFWWHLIPFAVVLVSTFPYYLLDADTKLYIIEHSFYGGSTNSSNAPLFRRLIIYLQFPHALFYTILAYQYVRKNSSNEMMNRPQKNQLLWLRNLILGFGLFFSFWLLYNILVSIGVNYHSIVDHTITYAMAIFIYTLGYYAFLRPEVYSDTIKWNGKKYAQSTLTPDKAQHHLEQLNQLMNKQKLYLKPGIRLSELAAKLDISTQHLSQIINERLNQNFFEYINGFRIEAAKELLSNPENHQFTLLSIAHQVGFNNKTSFNKYFKKHTGMTPSEYRAQINGKKA